ncbi:hypothetical protein KP509_13G060400 [Ceratopteris richardii]|uniref:Mitochondrial import receptor subunit TOM20 n=1 Tax=Ceratopteris richardii TaxID=49495 RepID=A0A8T2TFW9_CERRI|nr:hypothetical protein KP509_13G060400 [Ceratopteris richardii]
MEMGPEEYERLLFFESAREKAAQEYQRNPLDAENLIRWGGALLELAQFQPGTGSIDMVQDAEAKLEEALKINPKLANALWCLGNAHTSHGFLIPESDKANDYFQKASSCFQRALEEEPNNELFKKAVEMSGKAPDLHQELHKQLSQSQQVSTSSFDRSAAPKKKSSSDLKYDVLGWVVLAIGLSLWMKFGLPNPPSS